MAREKKNELQHKKCWTKNGEARKRQRGTSIDKKTRKWRGYESIIRKRDT